MNHRSGKAAQLIEGDGGASAVAALARRYRGLMAAGTLAFTVLCALTLWAGWVREYDAALSLASQRVQKEAIRLRAIVKAASDHVSQTARWAEDFPYNAPYPGPNDLRQAAQHAIALSENGEINLDVLSGRSPERRLGLLIALTEAARPRANGWPSNLELALPLLDRFRYGQETTRFLRWSYFFSARKDVLAMAPWAASADVLGTEPNAHSFLEHSWTYEITDGGRPENNPNRVPYWTKPYPDQAGAGLMVSYGIPVYWGDEFVGVMGADILLAFLTDFLREFPDPDGLLLITNARGELLADRHGNAATSNALQSVEAVLPPQLRPWDATAILDARDGRLLNGWHVISENIGEPEWSIVYLVPRATLAARVAAQFAPQMGLTALLVVALAVVSRFLRRSYVAPALGIADFVARENESTQPVPPSVPAVWRPWVDAMATAFRERREYLAELRTEIGDRKRAEESLRQTTRSLERVNRILTMLSEANEELVRADDESGLFEAMCRVIVETGGYPMAWVGLAEAGNIRPLAQAGAEDGFLASGFEWSAATPCGRVIATGQLWVEPDLAVDAATTPWRAAALARGYRSCIALPLTFDEDQLGVLSVYSTEIQAFGAQETVLFVDLANDLAYGVAVMRERERRVEMERILAHAQKMEALGQMAGGVAHDFNNLLGAILGFANFIAEDTADHDPAHYYARRIISAGKRGKAVISQILSFAHKDEILREPLDLGQMLAEVHTLASASIPSTTRLTVTNDMPEAVVIGDAGGLSRMLLNLCLNAHDAMGNAPGTVSLRIRPTDPQVAGLPGEDDAESGQVIRVWQDDDGTCHGAAGLFDPAARHVSLEVADTGCGMDAALLKKVFSPFFTTKDKGAGTGLGLAAVHRTVLAHGGALVVRSRRGGGTTFEMILPLADTVGLGLDETVPTAAPMLPSPCRVLLVDDDPDFGDMVLNGLERHGAEVAPCGDPLSALAGFQEAPDAWDVVVTDQTMPDMTGLELIRAVRAIRPHLPCILCTGFAETQLDDALLQDAGVFALLYKPLDMDKLLATVARAVTPRA